MAVSPAHILIVMWIAGPLSAAIPAVNLSQDATTLDSSPVSAAFAPASVQDIQDRLLQWMALADLDEQTARSITGLWADVDSLQSASADELLDRVVESLASADPGVRRLVDEANQGSIPSAMVFDGIRRESFFRDNVQLWYARWLTQHRLYDEAQQILDMLRPDAVVDPATYFFCRAVCQQQLLDASAARDSLALLLNNTLSVPARYRAVGEMMRQQLANDSDEGMPLVARVMNDVHRRLDLGRSGESTQQQETRVVDLLDKLLEDMEKQQQQQDGQGGGGQSQQNQSGTQGASQSQVKGSTGDGEANGKTLTENRAWGMLDKQAEAKARELIRKQFPSNFLDAISKYTQKIAEDER
jgi:hypothetical protein